jgi:C4-dicarboxylate transporter DctQ subunit
MSAYNALLNVLSKLVEFITGALLCAITLIVFYTVIAAKFLGGAPPWTNEAPLIMVIWFGLLGAGLGVRDKAHLAVEFMVRGLGATLKAFFFRLSYALMLAFAGVMTVAGFRLVFFTVGNQQTYPATKLPVGYAAYLAIPLAGIFIALHAMRHLIDLFTGDYDFTTAEDEDLAHEEEQAKKILKERGIEG